MDSSRRSWCRYLMAGAAAMAALPAAAQAVAATPSAVPTPAAPAAAVQAVAVEQPASALKVTGGGDFRLRQEYFDNIPIIADPPGVTRGGKNDALRFRTRLWGQAEMDGVSLNVRAVNEVRHWYHPSTSTSYEWPDEIVLDNLNLRFTDVLGDGTVLTVGRQDIMLGSGRLVLEGTAKDGSRTTYMDGAKFGVKLDDLTRLDLFGAYTSAEDDLAIGNEHRDVTGYKSGFNDMDESGGGAFVTSRYTEALPFELYYIYKHDSSYVWKPVAKNPEVRVPEADYHTVGTRLLPKFSTTVSGELEVAGQFGDKGDQDVEAMMAFAGLKWSPEATAKPYVSVNTIYLSGDDASTTDKVEGFNPLWGRYPWISEMYIYAYDAEAAGFWSNLIYPYVEAGCVPGKDMKLRASVGPIFADEDNGPGDGDLRGWLGIARFDFPIAKGLLGTKDAMKGHLLAEVLDPGDYYKVDDLAYFLRWELVYSF